MSGNNGKGIGYLARLETLSILYVAVFLTRIGFGTILIVFPVYLLDQNGIPISQSLSGVVLALYPALEGVSALPVGAWIDRSGRRRAFLAGMTSITVLTLAISFTRTNIPLVGGAHALMGLSAAMVTISSLTMITDLTVVENRGAGMGAFDLANLSGYGVGIVFGAVAETVFQASLGTIFQIVAIVFAIATAFTFLALREPPHAYQRRRTLSETLDNLTGDVSAIFPVWFSLTIIVGLYFFLPKLAQNSGTTLSNSAAIITVGLVALGAGALLFGRLSDKIGRTRTIMLGAIGEFGFLLLFPSLFDRLISIPHGTPWIDSLAIVGPTGVIAGAFFFLGSALVPSILAFVGDKAARDFRGSAMGLYSLMLSAGIAIGNVLAGFAAEFGGVQAVFFLGATIFSGLCLTTGILLRRGNHLASSARDLTKAESKPL
jgi:MFS family permease